MLARAFVIIGGLVVLVLFIALVGPLFVNWTSYRADFEREASAILGRKVTVAGSASARLIPFPSVTFTDVQVGGVNGAAPAMTIGSFSMDAELAPFLSGRVLIFDMRIDKPRATVTVGADGAIDWAVRPSTPVDPSRVSLEQVSVSDAEIVVHYGPGKRDHVIRSLDATVSAKTLDGPFHIDGDAMFDRTEAAFTVATGKAEADGAMRLLFRLQPKFAGFSLETDGDARLDRQKFAYSGAFALDQIAAIGLRDGAGGMVDGPGARVEDGWRVKGRFAADSAAITAESFRLETGLRKQPYVADGAARIDLGPDAHFELSVEGHQVQLGDETNGPGRPLADRLANLAETIVDTPPPPIPGTVSVHVPAIVAGDTTLRDVAFEGQAADGGWTISKLSAQFPGRTTLEASGFLAGGLTPAFSGDLLVAIGQPSGFAAWLAQDVDDAIRRLPGAGVAGKVNLTRERQSISDMELRLGDAAFSGSIERESPQGGAGNVAVEIDGGALDLQGLEAMLSIIAGGDGAGLLAGQGLEASIRAGPVDFGGLTAEKLDTALRFKAGTLELDRLLVDGVAGAHLSATATLNDFPNSANGKVDGALTGDDLAPLVDALAVRFADNPALAALMRRSAAWPGLFDAARVDFVGTLAAEDGLSRRAISANGTAGGTTFTLSAAGTFAGGALDGGSKATFSFDGANEDAGALMALAGLPALPIGQASAARLTADVAGKPAGELAIAAALESDADRLAFKGRGDVAGGAEGRLTLRVDDLGPWLMTAGTALPGLAEGFSADLASDAELKDGKLMLPAITGTLAGEKVSGALDWSLKDGRPYGTGRLALENIDLTLALRALYGDAAISGSEAWGDQPFAAASTLPVGGEFDVAAQNVSTGWGPVAQGTSFRLAIGPDALTFSDVRAGFAGGRLSGRAELRNNAGDGAMSLQATLAGFDLATVPDVPGVSGKADLSVSLTASGRSAEAMATSAAGSGTLALGGVTIAGIDATAFARIVAEAEREGAEIKADKAAAITRKLALTGSTTFGPTEAALSIAAGVARAENVALASEEAGLGVDARLDLMTFDVEALGEMRFAAGNEEVVGADPLLRFAITGPVAGLAVTTDAGPMAQFLVQRALEIEHDRVEALQAAIVEKQRLRRETRYFAWLDSERERAKAEEEARLKAEEEARLAAEAEAKKAAEAEAQKAAEAEAARKKAEEDAAAKAKAEEEAARKKAEDEAAAAKKAAEEAAAKQAAEEAAANVAPKPETRPEPVIPKSDNAPTQKAKANGAPGAGSGADQASKPKPDVFPAAPKPEKKQTIKGLFDFLKPKL